MLDIFKSKSSKIKAPVKAAPLKLGFLDEDIPANELDLDFVIVPASTKVKNVSAEIIDKKDLEEEIEIKAEPVKEVNKIPDLDIPTDISGDKSQGAVSEMRDVLPSVEPANTPILSNPSLALGMEEPVNAMNAVDESTTINPNPALGIKIPAEENITNGADASAPLQNAGSNNNKPCDEKSLLAVQIEHDVGAVTAVSPESLTLSHTIPDLNLIHPEVEGTGGGVDMIHPAAKAGGFSLPLDLITVKEKGRYDDVLTQILDIARGNPCDYGWERHSLRNLQKYLIAKKIVKKISHEKLRNILADNNIRWNGNGYHHKKKKAVIGTTIEKAIIGTMVVDECTGVSDAVGEAMGKAAGEAMGDALSKAVVQMQPGGPTAPNTNPMEHISSHEGVAKPYYPMILTDYQQPAVAVMIIKPKNEKLSENTVVIDNPQGTVDEKKQSGDVDVPPGIISDINNIKIYGPYFDPGQLEVVESYSIPHPIENPRVYIVKDGYKLRYLIIEPGKPEVYDKVRKALLRNVDIYPLDENKDDPVARLNRIVETLKKKYTELKNLSKDEERRLMYYLYRDFIGYREIDAAMRDEFIEDITCVGYGIPVFIYHQKHYNLVSDIVYQEHALDSMVLRMAQESGKHISISDPIVDAALKDGSRAQLTFKKTATDKGSTFTVRRFKSGHITPIDLIRKGTYSLEAMAYLWKCVQNGKNVLFVGGTATGKTTNLNACSFFIPPEVKIVSIEDTREIKLYQKNWIPSVATRDIDIFQLLKASLRQRPEYIIVGEVRGKEAQTLFQAMSSGHIVMSTFHAGSVGDLVNRLTSSPIDVPSAMLESLDVIVILKNEWIGVSSRHRFADAIYEQRRISETPRFVKIYDHVQGLSASLMTRELEHKITCLQGMINEKLSNPDRVSERIISHMYIGVKGKHG